MSNYWKKKLDELNEENEKKSSVSSDPSDYWGNKLKELEESNSKKNDIAPVAPTKTESKEEDEKWYDGFLQLGDALSDKFSLKNVAKTIIGTNTDAATNAISGVVGWGENIIDAGATAVGTLTEKLGMEDATAKIKEFAAKDLYDEKEVSRKILSSSAMPAVLGPFGNAIQTMFTIDDWINTKEVDNGFGGTMIQREDNSVFGDQADSVISSAGEIVAKKGLQAAAGGFPIGDIITGVTVYGAQAEEALKEEATFGEATGSGLISAGAEIIFEKLSGGIKIGGRTLDEGLTRLISKNISSIALRNFVHFATDVAGESLEELATEFVGNLGTKLYKEEDLGEILFSKEALNDYIRATFAGGLMGGFASGAGAIQAKGKYDYKNGMTENEQKVVDKIYNDRVAEESAKRVSADAKDGKVKGLSEKERAEIYNSIVEEMEKGYISTDTIEEVLGGDTFKSYQDAAKQEQSILSEYEELGKKTTPTLAEQHRYSELHDQVKEINENSKSKQLKSQLRSEVFGLVGNDRLVGSYIEGEKRREKFHVDLSDYDEKEKEVVQKAIDSGVLNNTSRTHEFVGMVAKISADKGVLFDFTNNEKLKDSGFAVEGKNVNGFVTKDGVTVNINSQKALNSVVGHEITHVLEGTELYTELQSALFEYAKTKKDYGARRTSIEALYRGIEGADVDAELTADLVGDYLFTDADFVKNLSTNHRNVFQKIYDEIKYLLKVATAGSKEARELERVKHAFDQAYKANGTAPSGTKYSLSDSAGTQLTAEQQEYFKDSKMRDDNGNLMVMYHGSQDAGFHVFDPSMSDDDTSLFFVDRNDVAASYSGTSETYAPKAFKTAEDANKFFAEIGKTEYEVVENDGEYTLLDDGDEVATSESLDEIYQEFCDYEGVGYGDANYKVYLNLTNPLVVDAQGGKWNDLRNWSKSAFVNAEDVAVKRVDGEFRLFDKTTNSEIENSTVAVNSYTESMDRNSLLHLMLDKANYALSINAEHLNTTRDVSKWAKAHGYDGVIFKNIHDNGGYSNGSEGASTVAIAFDSNQIKSVANDKPTGDPDIRYSLSENGEARKQYGNYNVYGEDVGLEKAPTKENAETPKPSATESTNNMENGAVDVADEFAPISEEQASAQQRESLASLDDADAPPEMDAPFYGESEEVTVDDPFEKRDIKAVGNPKKKAYMYENPEVKPFFQAEANIMLGELRDTTKGERWAIKDDDGYIVDWGGVKRNTSMDIAYLLDNGRGNGRGYTYDEIEAGLKAIIEDNGKENNACSKRIEFLLNDRLLKGNVDFQTGLDIPPNQDYINLLNEKQITEYNEEAFGRFMENADQFAPVQEDVTRVQDGVQDAPIAAAPVETATNEAPIKETKQTEPKTDTKTEKTAEIIYGETEKPKRRGLWSLAKEYLLDNGMVFEGLAKKTKNRELEGRWNSIRYSDGKAQNFIKNGKNGAKSIEALRNEVESAGLTEAFDLYIYHKHNVDRMSLESRVAPKIAELKEQLDGLDDAQIAELAQEPIKHKTPKDEAAKIRSAREYTRLIAFKNKPVFGDTVTAEVSQANVDRWEKQYPVFKKWADEVYANNKYLRQLMVDEGLITQETAELWDVLYPHYVPIRRKNHEGAAINVPLDSNKTGVNAPIKRATGGNSDFYGVFETMGTRAMQTYKAIAKNRFGVELMNTLGTTISQTEATLDDAMNVDAHDELLKEGKNGMSPTFTIFEDGKRVEFEITNEMYDALRPAGDALSYTNPVLNKLGNLRRALLTSHNPTFMITNPIKDSQDILINSQHPAKTYWNLPQAAWQMLTKGEYYGEYMENGGEDNTYFEKDTNTFKKERSGFVKALGIPLNAIDKANNFVERLPRLAEYMASRKDGRSIDVSMLDAARVTTNFAAGGKLTKLANRNGVTFLNASVQGAVQQVRNVQEAKMNGLKGWVGLAAKVTAAGLPALLLNHLLWDDDEEYGELSDYVKDNYYIVAKTEDGHFVRIPKGRAVAVIQNAFEQMENLVTGNDEVDFGRFFDLVKTNLAPNSVTDNNLISPIMQVNKNEAWYGEDLVPTRLQDLPEAEQFDESTDSLSKWLGEKLNYSPYKINYLLDQYGGGVSDMVLPMLTPDAERGDGNMITAPFLDKFTTDPTMKNQTVSDFYTKVDELTVNANSAKATDEDILKSKYMNSINSELGELYGKKREIQNSDLSDAEKYAAVREIQEQINALTKDSLDTYNSVNIDGGYATVGDRHYRMNKDGEWEKITDKQLEKQEDVTKGLGIDASEYWSNKDEYDFAYDYPEKYAFFEENGITYDDYDSADEDGKRAYSWAAENPEKYTLSKAVTDDLFEYRRWSSELYDIKADKDENGESISGSAKEKKRAYIFGLDLDYGQKAILYRSLYDSKDDKAEFNMTIVNYLNSREDISYEQMVAILTELDFKVNGQYITW